MLNYDTIISSYDDKLTLMQWLKKVEYALKNASAVSFNVNQRGNATLTFSVVFEDGSEIETGPIVLQQGESVESAAIVNGHLILTLTNGDTLDAGDLGGVSSFSIDGSQHLIVHYQNGTTQDLGAIFTGNVSISGNLAVSGTLSAARFNGDTNMETIKDANGNLRFIEGNGEAAAVAGITSTYCKWSLSGTHLMLVFAGSIEDESVIANNTALVLFNLPAWVLDKIFPVWSNAIEVKTFALNDDNWSTQTIPITLYKTSNDVRLYTGTSITLTAKRYFRMYFDLLIDNA